MYYSSYKGGKETTTCVLTRMRELQFFAHAQFCKAR